MGLLLTACIPGGSDETNGDGAKDAFMEAATALSASPAVGYHIRMPGMTMQMRSTRDGSATGTITLGGTRTSVLTVGGKTYVRWQNGLLGGPASRPGQASMLKDKWVTGSVASGMGRTLTPKQLGETLTQQLAQPDSHFPSRDTTVTIEGKPAWKASTPTSDVYVTTTAPHRVLRIMPKGLGAASMPGLPSLPGSGPNPAADLPSSAPSPSERASRSQARRQPAAPASAAPGQIDLDQMDPRAVDDLFNDLVSNTKQLKKNSVDLSYQFDTQGKAAFTGCGPGSCTVTMTVSSTFVSTNVKPPKNIDAMMTVSMTGGGTPVGGCATSGSLPVNGTGSLSCTNTSPAWSSWYNRARNQRGTHVYTALAQVVGRALSEATVDYLIEELLRRHEEYQREHVDTSTPTASPSRTDSCTPQAPTYGPLDAGRGTSGSVVLCDPPPGGSAASIDPRGFVSGTHDRGHLIGDRFGGSGSTLSNIVTLYTRMNQVVMRTCENRVADLVKAEDPVDYTVTANYVPGQVIPASITLTAKGSKGTLFTKTIPNTPTAGHVCKK
ncbi:DNA/RNA non-specific endonuclease [Streptomyces exfoliatus]|uniref:DNA/RNA non-specific endonuclease n=1 Tax=Streptomyces exfoliatus TaxID=1905 RepID=UPI003C2AE6C8